MKHPECNKEADFQGLFTKTAQHELLHWYDYKEIRAKSFFRKQYQNVTNDLKDALNEQEDRKKAEVFCSMFNKKIELIATIMESMKPGEMKGYIKEIKVSINIPL